MPPSSVGPPPGGVPPPVGGVGAGVGLGLGPGVGGPGVGRGGAVSKTATTVGVGDGVAVGVGVGDGVGVGVGVAFGVGVGRGVGRGVGDGVGVGFGLTVKVAFTRRKRHAPGAVQARAATWCVPTPFGDGTGLNVLTAVHVASSGTSAPLALPSQRNCAETYPQVVCPVEYVASNEIVARPFAGATLSVGVGSSRSEERRVG